MLIVGEILQMWGQGIFRNSVLPTQFCCEPTPALKNSLLTLKTYFLKRFLLWQDAFLKGVLEVKSPLTEK